MLQVRIVKTLHNEIIEKRLPLGKLKCISLDLRALSHLIEL